MIIAKVSNFFNQMLSLSAVMSQTSQSFLRKSVRNTLIIINQQPPDFFCSPSYLSHKTTEKKRIIDNFYAVSYLHICVTDDHSE